MLNMPQSTISRTARNFGTCMCCDRTAHLLRRIPSDSADGALVVPLQEAVSKLAHLNKGYPVIKHLLACVLVASQGEVQHLQSINKV